MEISPDDLAKWLAVAGTLAAVGFLPRKWKAPIAALTAAVAIWRFLDD